MRARAAQTAAPYAEIDDVAERFTGNAFAGLRSFGVISLGSVLGALALKLVLVEDESEVARARLARLPKVFDGKRPARKPRHAITEETLRRRLAPQMRAAEHKMAAHLKQPGLLS